MQYRIRGMEKIPGQPGVQVFIDFFDDDADFNAYPPPRCILHDVGIIDASREEDVTEEMLIEFAYERGWQFENQAVIETEKLAPKVQQMMQEPRSLGSTTTLPRSARKRRAQIQENARREAEAQSRREENDAELEAARREARETDDPSSGGTDDPTERDGGVEDRTTKRGRGR